MSTTNSGDGTPPGLPGGTPVKPKRIPKNRPVGYVKSNVPPFPNAVLPEKQPPSSAPEGQTLSCLVIGCNFTTRRKEVLAKHMCRNPDEAVGPGHNRQHVFEDAQGRFILFDVPGQRVTGPPPRALWDNDCLGIDLWTGPKVLNHIRIGIRNPCLGINGHTVPITERQRIDVCARVAEHERKYPFVYVISESATGHNPSQVDILTTSIPPNLNWRNALTPGASQVAEAFNRGRQFKLTVLHAVTPKFNRAHPEVIGQWNLAMRNSPMPANELPGEPVTHVQNPNPAALRISQPGGQTTGNASGPLSVTQPMQHSGHPHHLQPAQAPTIQNPGSSSYYRRGGSRVAGLRRPSAAPGPIEFPASQRGPLFPPRSSKDSAARTPIPGTAAFRATPAVASQYQQPAPGTPVPGLFRPSPANRPIISPALRQPNMPAVGSFRVPQPSTPWPADRNSMTEAARPRSRRQQDGRRDVGPTQARTRGQASGEMKAEEGVKEGTEPEGEARPKVGAGNRKRRRGDDDDDTGQPPHKKRPENFDYLYNGSD